MLLMLGNTWRFRLCNVSYFHRILQDRTGGCCHGSEPSFISTGGLEYGVRTPAAVWWIMTQTSVLETSSIYSMKNDDDNGEEKSKEIIEQER